jgi:hypothetical protein
MATGAGQPFRVAGTASVAAGTASAAVALVPAGDSVLVTNAAGAVAFVRFGADPSVSARTTDLPVLPGGRVLLGGLSRASYGAAVLASGSGTVFFTTGEGSVI